MRIGFLTTSYPRDADDSAGVFVRGLARALVDRGHTIDVLCAASSERAHASEPGIDVHALRYAPDPLARTFYGPGAPDALRRDPRAWLGAATYPALLAREAQRRAAGWDAIVSHWAVPSGLVGTSLRTDARPHVAILHGADAHLLAKLPRVLTATLARGADALVMTSRAMRTKVLARIADAHLRLDASARAHVCAMGVDAVPPPTDAQRAAARLVAQLTRPTLLVLARLVPIKGVGHAIDALAGRTDVELVIAGNGPLRASLEAHARRVRCPARFVGHVGGEAKEALLAGADVVLVPSIELPSGRTEGAPTVVLEAMQRGRTVIASRTGGIPDVVDDGESGLLVPPGDMAGLRAAIDRVLEDPPLRRSLELGARERARAFEWSDIAAHIEQLLTRSA